MNKIILNLLVILGTLNIIGCTATTSLSSVQPGAVIDVKEEKIPGIQGQKL